MRDPRGATGRVLQRLWRKTSHDRVVGQAAEVSFFAVLSFFPSLIVAASALGLLDHLIGRDLAELSREQVMGLLRSILTERAEPAVGAINDLFTVPSQGLLTTALVLSIYTMSMGFLSVIGALDRVYQVAERRSWWRRRLTAIALSLGSAIMLALMLALVVLGPLLGSGEELASRIGLGSAFTFLWDWMRAPLVFVILIVWATTMYRLAPAGRRSWIGSIPGGAVAAVLWLAGSYGLKFYLLLAASANRVLGMLGGGLILMVWVYILTFVLLLGAELNSVLRISSMNASARGSPD